MKRSVDARFDSDRYTGESILECFACRDAQFGSPAAFGLTLLDTAMGLNMIEGATLIEQTQHNFAMLTLVSDNFRDVVEVLC